MNIGRVLGTFGVRGHVKCAYTTDNRELIPGFKRLLMVEPRTHEMLPLTIDDVQLREENFLLRFNGFTAPEPLKRYGGWNIVRLVEIGSLPREEGEIYYFELEGMEVRDPAGNILGKVRGVLETPAHVLLELTAKGAPLIPFTRHHVPELNLDEGWLITNYPLGDREVVE